VQALAKTYESMNDKWRALGYQKAITALKKHSEAITSFEVLYVFDTADTACQKLSYLQLSGINCLNIC